MISNNNLTVYHKGLDLTTKMETWTRYNYSNIWWFGGKGAGINKGYDNANDVEIRIPYNSNINIANFSIGDIVVEGTLELDITTTKDLKDYNYYNITSINNNNFGNNPHIHLGGK